MKIVIALLAFVVVAWGEEGSFYIQPDIGWRTVQRYQNKEMQWESWGKYYGLSVRYELLREDHMYAGAEAYMSYGAIQLEGRDEQYEYRGMVNGYNSKIEGKMGKGIKVQNLTVIPFLGFGDYSVSQGSSYYVNTTYIPLGVRAQYSFQHLNIGLQCEQLKYFHIWYKTDEEEGSGNVLFDNANGYEISLPILFRIEGKWNACLEPYYLRISDDFTFFGGRFAAGFKF